MSTPYTYLIGWPEHDKWYYGVRYSQTATPDDLWVTYFTSSRHVRNFREMHGEPSIRVVRRTFDQPGQARAWETKVLKRLNAVTSDRFLNQSFSDGSFYAPPEHLKKLQNLNKGRALTPEHKAKLSKAGAGKSKSEDHKKAIANALTGKVRPESVRNKISETRKRRGIKSSTSHMNTEMFYCSKCDKHMTKGNFIRWHQH